VIRKIPRYKVKRKERRAARRQKAAQEQMFGPKPKANRSQAHREQAPHHVAFDAAEIKATGAGAWTGPRAAKHKRGGRKGRVWTYAELMTEGNDLIEWDGM
jgi:hypothetical protein